MPGLVHKLVIVAAIDALLLKPSPLRNQRANPTIQISYKTNAITPLGESTRDINKDALSVEVYGIVGTFSKQ